ncbi:MAG: hypothetical protein HYY85_02775 [Deltaproteobacteria bacterium]|nr:hypothetical protein [Deltaproteobacteria bacterium]
MIEKINGEPINTGEKAMTVLSEHVTAKKPMTIEVERGVGTTLTLTYRPR